MYIELTSVNSNHKATEMTNSDWANYDANTKMHVVNRKSMVNSPIYPIFGVATGASIAVFWAFFGVMRARYGTSYIALDATLSSGFSLLSLATLGTIGIVSYFVHRNIQKQVEIDDTVLTDRTTQIQALIERNNARVKQMNQNKETIDADIAKLETKNKELSTLLSNQKV